MILPADSHSVHWEHSLEMDVSSIPSLRWILRIWFLVQLKIKFLKLFRLIIELIDFSMLFAPLP